MLNSTTPTPRSNKKSIPPIENVIWLSIECSASARSVLENLVGPPTVVVENGGARTNPETGETTSRLYLYYRLKTPTGSREELAKLELARELAAKIVGGDPSNMPPEQLSPKIYRILTQNLDAEINLDAALRVLFKAAKNGGDPHAKASEQPQSPAASPMLTAALGLAKQRDWKVFPARMEDGKKWSWLSAKYAPGGENWGMTNDPEQLQRNFTNPKWQSKCGVGVPTGWVNRIFDIEGDTKEGHGVDGLASLQKLEAKYGKLPDTLMMESLTGSLHRIYKHPGRDIRIISRSLPEYSGVDIKGDGGMFVAPPSVRGDGEYRWLNDSPIAEAPQWLIDLTTAKGNGKGANAKGAPGLEIAEEFKGLNPGQGLGQGVEYPTADIEQIRAAFAVIPNDDRGWDDWNKCGMALFHATGGSDDGLAVFHAWSSKSEKYNKQVTTDRWAAYKTCPPERIGAGSIFHWANEAAPGWEQERRAKQIAENIKIGDDVTEPLLPQIMTLKEMHERLVFIGSTGGVADLITGRVR
jgi:hypothetical protein